MFFIRQAAEANIHIDKAQRTSLILVFIDDVEYSQIFWDKKVVFALLWCPVKFNSDLYEGPLPLLLFSFNVSFSNYFRLFL